MGRLLLHPALAPRELDHSESRGAAGPFSPQEVDVFEALARPITSDVANAPAFEEIARLDRLDR